MLYIELFVAFLIILGVFLLLKKKAIVDYEAKDPSFKILRLDVMKNSITENEFTEMSENCFLFVNIDNKEYYMIFGPYAKHRALMDFFMKNHNKISGRSYLVPYNKIVIFGGGKIYYNPEKKLLAFYYGNDEFGFYEKEEIEKFQNEIKEIFSVDSIDYGKDTYYNYEERKDIYMF